MINLLKIMQCLFRFVARSTGLLALLLCSLLVAGMVLPEQQLFAAGFEILTPESGATIVARNAETHLVLRQTLSGKSNVVRLRHGRSVIKPVVLSEDDAYEYVHFRVPLTKGMNSFGIEPGGPQIELTFLPVQSAIGLKRDLGRQVSLFHQDPTLPAVCQDCHALHETGTVSPVGLAMDSACAACHENLIAKGAWRHSATANQQCLACHRQSSEPDKIGFPDRNVSDYCFACHTGKRDWLSRGFIHGPLVIGGCTLCHNPHGENNRYQLFLEGSLDLCIACHSDQAGLVAENSAERVPYVHGIVPGGGCVICHEPHATDQPFTLKKPVNELCGGCHPDIMAKAAGHPVPNHPVAAPRELLRPERKLTCASCHDPHGTVHKLMLIETPIGGRLCRECHRR